MPAVLATKTGVRVEAESHLMLAIWHRIREKIVNLFARRQHLFDIAALILNFPKG